MFHVRCEGSRVLRNVFNLRESGRWVRGRLGLSGQDIPLVDEKEADFPRKKGPIEGEEIVRSRIYNRGLPSP